MAKLHDDWKVLPHGPVRQLEVGLLTVVGQIPMPLGNFPRRMTVVALPEGRSLIFSPIALGDEAMERVESLGTPAFLVIPNGGHRLDARPFKARYPKARVITAAGARAAVEEAVPVDSTAPELGGRIVLEPVAGTDQRELALLVLHDGGSSLLVNDIVGNVRHPQGPGAWVMARLMGFGAHGPQVPRVARRFFIKDPAALAAQFDEWASLPGLRRIIPSHGDIIDDQPGAALRTLAASLR